MKKIIILSLAALLASACQKESPAPRPLSGNGQTTLTTDPPQQTSTTTPPQPMVNVPSQLQGKYVGTFYFSINGLKQPEEPIGFAISGNKYNDIQLSDKNNDKNNCAAGYGTVMLNQDLLNFSPVPVAWSDLMEQGQVYANGFAAFYGNYHYTLKGDSLFLNSGSCFYKLKKQ